MNILILKDQHEYYLAHGYRLFHAHFAGHWDDDMFLVRKDRLMGNERMRLTSEQLTNYINHYMEAV
jgi:hypothetical protein